jgi:hypothetical protein
VIYLDGEVLGRIGDFERILVHELFHFAWVRLGNPRRRAWELHLAKEMQSLEGGELGWSSEWRKQKLTDADVPQRSPAWRHYVCESFCDTAARLYSGLSRHPEFTLGRKARDQRRRWFREYIEPGPVSI